MEYIGISKFEKHSKNPFAQDVIFEVETDNKKIKIGNGKDIIVDTDTGEVKGTSVRYVTKKYDSEQFKKVFRLQQIADLDLSKHATKVFFYIMDNLQVNKDFIFFDFDECSEFTKYKTKKTILNALGQLVDKKIIARSKSHNIYFINPAFIFNGDRLIVINEYIRELKEENPTILNEQGKIDSKNR